ncbi:hypothetical protein V5F53_16140 [Xanthobacter sp. V4C-4]|uniref:hypothetical protein n=1 Tax=Xanthobacter cornucopiae TaxID=3119924 RepID=UPI003729AFE3
MRGNRKDSSEIALYVDLHLALHRRQHNLIHQRANGVGGFDPFALIFILKGIVEVLYPLAVLQRHARVEQGRRLVRFGEEPFQIDFSGFKLLASLFHHFYGERIAQVEIENLFQFSVDLGQLGLRRGDAGAAFHAETIHLLREDLTEMGKQLRINEPGAQRIQDP